MAAIALIIFTSILLVDAVLNLILWRVQKRTQRHIAEFLRVSVKLGFLTQEEINAVTKR